MTVPAKVLIYSRLIVEIVGSNLEDGMDVHPLCVFGIVLCRKRSLQ